QPTQTSPLTPSLCKEGNFAILQSRCGRLDRRLERQHALCLRLALVNLVTVGHVKLVQRRASKNGVRERGSLWLRNNGVDTSCLITDLQADLASHVEKSLTVDGHPIGTALRGSVCQMQVKIRLFVRQRPVWLNLKGVNHLAGAVGYQEQALV